MGVIFTEIDTSDGTTIGHYFNTQSPPNQIVFRYTFEVSKDLTDKGIQIGLVWFVTRLADNKVVMVDDDVLQTHPGDLGAYIVWYDGVPASNFLGKEFYKFQVVAANRGQTFLAFSPEWYFYVYDN